MQDEDITVEIIHNPEQVFQQERALYDVAIATAKKYPRNLSRSIENAIVVATIDEETAKECNFALPRAGKVLQGPSINLAKIIMQSYGNFRCEAKVISTDATHVTSRSVAFDLENNVAVAIEVKRSILQNEWKDGRKTGRMIRMNDDMITVTGNAANSIAMRNAIFAVIPKQVTNKVYNAAKALITGDLSDEDKFLKRRTEVFTALKDNLKLEEEEILFALGKASIANVTKDDILALIGFGQAIKDGDSTVEEIFKKKKGTDSAQEKNVAKEKQLQALFTAKEKKIPDEDLPNVKRVIDMKETASYNKIIKFLKELN